MLDSELECCEETKIHKELLKAVNATLPEENELYDLAELDRKSVV